MNTSNDSTAGERAAKPYFTDRETFNMMTTGFFSCIVLFGFIGNCLVIMTLSRWKNWKSSCNFLVANIAAADLGVVMIAAPLRIAERYLEWPSGLFLCNVVYPLQDVFVCVSIVTHSAIALERYRATVTPFKPRLSKKTSKIAILMIWVGCYITVAIPQAIPGGPVETDGSLPCSVAIFSTPLYRRIFVIYQVVLFVVAQLLIQTVAYTMVIRTVRVKDNFLNMLNSRGENTRNCKQRLGKPSLDSRPSCTAALIRVRKTQRLVKLLLVLVIAFQLCHLPRGTSMLIHEFSPKLTYYYLDLVFLALYYLKHVINPVILYAMSKEFQDALKTCYRHTMKYTETSSIIVRHRARTFSRFRKAAEEKDDINTFEEVLMPVRETTL